MPKTGKCSLQSITTSVCDDIINGTVLVTNKVKIPETNLDMDLIGKELCRYHYNKLIVNENHRLASAAKKQQCAYPKHEEYIKNNNKGGRPRKNFLKKIPQRLQPILNLPPNALICNPCLNAIDHDEECQQSSDYQPPTRKVSSSIVNFEHSHILRSGPMYSAKEFKELEIAYHEVCEELDQVKLSSISFSEKIHLMSNILYKKQRKDGEKPIYDPDEFKKMLEEEEPKLQGFFDELVASANPQKKNLTTNQQNKKKLVAMCHFLAGLNNKFINDVKTDIGFLLSMSGASASAIETLANAGITIRRETIQKRKHQLAKSHLQTVKDYVIENKNYLIILNIDDYHNIHTLRQPDTTTTSNALHFITILMKASTQFVAVPSNNQLIVQNPKSVDSSNIIIRLELQYMKILSITYQDRKKFFTNLFELSTHEDRIEQLLIHSYDIRIAERKDDRSMHNTKLVNLLEGNLHSTKDYLLAVQSIIDVPEINAYLERNIMIAPMDYPGQKNVRRAIVHRSNNGEKSNIPSQILNILPFIGPLHVSLNSRETVFLINYDFFEKMYHSIFGFRKILAKKPKPYRINLLLELAFKGWLLVKKVIQDLICNCKDPEARVSAIKTVLGCDDCKASQLCCCIEHDICYCADNDFGNFDPDIKF